MAASCRNPPPCSMPPSCSRLPSCSIAPPVSTSVASGTPPRSEVSASWLSPPPSSAVPASWLSPPTSSEMPASATTEGPQCCHRGRSPRGVSSGTITW
eukprot:scaffold48415_cov61-Phaeocystis_antarctica.AAC.5